MTPSRALRAAVAATLLPCSGLAATMAAPAVDPETARAAAAVATATPRPDGSASDFQKWSYDTLVISAQMCWTAAFANAGANGSRPAQPLPPGLRQRRLRAGTFSLPRDAELAALCKALAQEGFKPWCNSGRFYAEWPSDRLLLPADYLQFKSVAAAPKVSGGLNCFVTEQPLAKQFFAPDTIAARWIAQPHRQQFNLPGQPGAASLVAGTVEISLPHVPSWDGSGFALPLTAVIVD